VDLALVLQRVADPGGAVGDRTGGVEREGTEEFAEEVLLPRDFVERAVQSRFLGRRRRRVEGSVDRQRAARSSSRRCIEVAGRRRRHVGGLQIFLGPVPGAGPVAVVDRRDQLAGSQSRLPVRPPPRSKAPNAKTALIGASKQRSNTSAKRWPTNPCTPRSSNALPRTRAGKPRPISRIPKPIRCKLRPLPAAPQTLFSCKTATYGAIAQLAERLDRTQEVGGSNPPSSTHRHPLQTGRLRSPGGNLNHRLLSPAFRELVPGMAWICGD
jgi:hypothetical protein